MSEVKAETKVDGKPAVFGKAELLRTVMLWRAEGHDPLAKLECIEFTGDFEGYRYAFGLADFGMGGLVFESDVLYKTRAAAIAAIGRALDAEKEGKQ